MPTMPRARQWHASGIITYADSSQSVVFAGGREETSSDIFDLGTGLWRPGPELPLATEFGRSVPYGSDSFLIAGGFSMEVFNNVTGASVGSILWFDPAQEVFTPLNSMATPRYDFAAFLVPEDLVNCS